ncbi:MAG: AMP-binding protein [Clostridia bacterium]|nr:AMP-binding protein [Clostridia bacterium]
MKNRKGNYPLYDIKEITNLRDLICFDDAKNDRRTAFIYKKNRKETVNVSYAQFNADVDAFGTYLFENNFRKTKIAVMGENSYEWILTYFSTVTGDNIIVPVDKELPVAEMTEIISETECSMLVYSATYSEEAKKIAEKVPSLTLLDMNDIPAVLDKGKELLAEAKNDFVNYNVNDDDIAAIVYTSGTTGSSKGVILTHRNIAIDAVASCKNVLAQGTTICILPLHHTFSFTLGIGSIVMYRQPIYITKSIKTIMNDFKEAKPSYLFLVPMVVESMYKKIWVSAEEQGKTKLLKTMIKVSNGLLKVGIDLRRVLFKSVLEAFGGNLEWVSCGGAAVDINIIKGFRDFGVNIINGYGITECSPVVSSNRPEYWVDGSVGVPLCCCEVKIAEPDNNGIGEILVKGETVMQGYYKDEEATRQVFRDGWFRTGDMGKYENGVLYITGRKKNLIILKNGKNLSPEKIESELTIAVPEIKEVVVYGENDLITAEIFPDYETDGAKKIIEEKIRQYNIKQPAYRQISDIKFRDEEFPKTTTKKIRRTYKEH